MMELIRDLPVIALRGMTILPYMVIHFDVSRKQSIKSVDYAMKNGQRIFLVAQKSIEIEEPQREDVYDTGTVCEVRQIVKMPGGLVRVLVKGLQRAELTSLSIVDGFMSADVLPSESGEPYIPDAERDARISMLKEMMKKYYIIAGRDQGDNVQRLQQQDTLDELVYRCVAECTNDYEVRQSILDEEDLLSRFDMVCDLICKEIEISEIKKELAQDIKERIDKHQKEYVMREQLQVIHEELGDGDVEEESEELRSKAAQLNASDEVKNRILKEIKRYEAVSGGSAEAAVIRTYIDTLLELPWNERSEDNNDITNAQKVLDNDHYGLKDVKERVVEFLAVRALNSHGDSPIICLVGPPGTGKTSIASSVAKALNRKYIRICLGGVRDEAEIRGHRKTYVGAMPGRIIEGLKQAKVGNPLMLLDEIDKVGTDSRGDTASALLEILDSAQNSAFIDHYIETPVDLSEVLFIATANDTSTIPRPLLDRMEVIEVNSYTQVEKFHIAREHLIAKQLEKNGLRLGQLAFTDEAVNSIIEGYTREAGVRELERRIGAVCRKAAKEVLGGRKSIIKVTDTNLKKYLGTAKYDKETVQEEDQTGIVKGLAWTSVGGTTLDVEACIMDGKGELVLTGKLGDVMRESAMVARGYIRSEAEHYRIPSDMFVNKDIHLHVPEGAVPKDGPSAGITITLAMLSALTGRKVRHDIAMTGEITLHGHVLPIGGLKEKILAAKKIGIMQILVPAKNKKDVADIDEEILKGLKITYVTTMDDVVKAGLRGGLFIQEQEAHYGN